nr:cation channel sperm-associated targeting subunit tau [Mirounga angustirostris]
MEPPQELLKGSNTADNRGGQVRSLYTAPILQKSPNVNLEIMHSRASEFSSARKFQDHNKTMYLPKDENKEGAGYRLLNMLRKTLKGSESKELEITPEVPTLIPFGDVVGCLAVHIKNCRHFTPRISLYYSNLFIRISINNIVKCTKMCSLLSQNDEKNTTINFDDRKYFSVQVPRRQDDERNNIYLELMQYKNTEKYPLFLGSVQVHLYDVIQKGCFIEEFEMLNKSTLICKVEVEFMFSYGNFGYGFSHQLKPLQKIIEPSMFMNIAPPPERIDPVTNVITPQPIEYPAFLSPDLNVTVGMPAVVPQSNQPSVVRLEKLQQQPRERLFIRESRVSKNTRFIIKVIFSPKEHILPAFRPEYIEFKPKYQFQKFNFKDGFDPFLRNINKKMSVRKRKDQDMSKCRNTLNAEVIEHEDQDPPYPTYSKTVRPTNKTWPRDPARDPDFITVKTLDTKNNLARDPNMTTIETLDTKNNLKERLPNVSLPNFEGESSVTGNINTYRLSKSLSLTSHLENLKQSMMLKSILSKNLQDLSEKLFSKPEVPMDTEARKKSHSSLLLSVHDEPPSSLENKVCEKVQDLNNWLPEKDIVSSKSLLKQIIKDIPADSLSRGGPRNSPEVETALVSEKHLDAGEINFPIKKNNFKQKHSKIEVSSSKPGISDTANDYVTKQIFTAPIFSELEIGVKELSETPVNLQNQLPTAWESLSSNILLHYEENDDEIELPQAKSVRSQIIQAFPIDTLLESGIIKVIELDKQYQKSSMLDTETVFAEEEPKYSTEDYSETQSRTESLSEQNTLIIPKETTSSFNRVEYMDEGQNISLQDSKYQSTPDKKTDMLSNSQRFDREENDLNSTSENLSNSLMGKLNDSDVIMLRSFLKHMFNIFFKYNQSERRQPEKELERLIQHPFPNNTEDLEEIKENFDKTDKLDRKPILSSKLRVFLEELSESEIKNLKSELSKHIQHYLVERLSESGHITKEDLPKIYQNLYLMNEKVEPKGQNIFLEKYSETVKEVMSFVNNFNHHFIDKHLEIKLRSFLNEILQNYFLKNLSESSLFKETESETIDSNMSSLRTKSASISFHELGRDISRGNFGKRLDLNMKYPLNKSLQNYLIALSENELLNLKADLSKHLQSLFIEKLSKSGLIKERQLEGINQRINLINSSSIPFKCIKPDLSFRNENQFMEENSEKQNKYSKIVQKTTLQKTPEDRLIETELTKKEEKEYFPLQNIKENPSVIEEQKRYYPKEGAKTLRLIEVQPSFVKNTQVIPLNKSSERLTDIVLKKQRKEHGFIQLPRVENHDFKTEMQDPHGWSGKSKTTQSNIYFERTLKVKPLEKREHNIYKLMAQEKPEAVLSPYPRIPNCKMPSENEEYIYKYTFPSRQNNTLTHFNLEAGEKLKLEDQYIQRLKGNNNNNKKHLVTFAQYKKIHTLSVKTNGICNEKYAKFPESQSFKYKVVEAEKNSKPSLFPEVLKRENLKPKVRKERDHVHKQKKSFSKIVKILPATLPTARILRKSVPRTLLHWTARRTIHDCSDRFEDIPVTSFKHAEQAKSRTRLLGKSPDDSHNQLKHFARPNTAPEVHKRRENYSGKFTSPRMVSAGLVHINDANPDYEIHKMRQKRKLKENIEKCSLICDTIQMLKVQNDM